MFAGYRRIIRRTYELPNGRVADFDVTQGMPFVGVFAMTPDEQVVLVRQFRPGPEEFLLECPAGRIEDGESPEVGAARELLEETGYAGELTLLQSTWSSPYTTSTRYAAMALNCKRIAEPTPDPCEFIETILIPLSEFRALLLAGQITDALSAYVALTHLDTLAR